MILDKNKYFIQSYLDTVHTLHGESRYVERTMVSVGKNMPVIVLSRPRFKRTSKKYLDMLMLSKFRTKYKRQAIYTNIFNYP